jgi:Putative Flp pilus-assembly TadE/G-like
VKRAGAEVSEDSGQILVLMIGFLALAAMLVVIVVNLSRVFLHDRSLGAAADGAALAAVQAVDESAIYGGALEGSLPLDPVAVDQEVRDYVESAGLSNRFDDFGVVETRIDEDGVVVVLAATVDLPFVGVISNPWADGVTITAESRATAPLQ